jgi:peptide/nickel transport system permease protein
MVGSIPRLDISSEGTVETNGQSYKINETPPRVSEARRILKVMFSRWLVVLGVFGVIAFLVIGIFAPLISPYDPNQQDLSTALQKPSHAHLLGTDNFGRDVLSRIFYGTRISLLVGVVAVTIASALGITLGLIAGYFSGWINTVIMRCMDAMLAIPPLVLALVIATALGGGLMNLLISLGISMMPGYCRLTCGLVLSLKESDYIVSQRAVGANNVNIMFRHILPNAFAPLLVLITLMMGTMILAEAGLSFLGVGVAPPTPTWGSMVSIGYLYLLSNPILSFSPGIAIALLVLSFNMVGDGLRDALDPRLRGVL